MLQNDDDSFLADADGADFRAETELRGAAGPLLVPEKDLVGREPGVGPTADEGHVVAS